MFDRFTDRARKVMALATQEAQRFNHEFVGTEHILLGLVKEGTGVGANFSGCSHREELVSGVTYKRRLGDIAIYGQELNSTTWRLAKMNLAIRVKEANTMRAEVCLG